MARSEDAVSLYELYRECRPDVMTLGFYNATSAAYSDIGNHNDAIMCFIKALQTTKSAYNNAVNNRGYRIIKDISDKIEYTEQLYTMT